MKIQNSSVLAVLALSTVANTVTAEDNLFQSHLRGDADLELEQYSCTIEGAAGQDQCDAAKDESGKQCVWCSIGSLGACLSADQAAIIEDKIPGMACDDTPAGDDDKAPSNDDAPAADDDASPPNDDDSTYWKCLKDGSGSEGDCESHGCKWCTSKAGFGVCLDEKAAEAAAKSDWFTCKLQMELKTVELMDLKTVREENKEEEEKDAVAPVQAPGNPFCILATMQQDESVCTSTVDNDGNPCAWCNIDNVNLCLDKDLAKMAQQYGGSCGDDAPSKEEQKFLDPADTTCIVATLQQDETACTSTSDSDGRACEWCTIAQAEVCLNADQAQLAEQFGGSCGDNVAQA